MMPGPLGALTSTQRNINIIICTAVIQGYFLLEKPTPILQLIIFQHDIFFQRDKMNLVESALFCLAYIADVPRWRSLYRIESE
jgi:hypothetical protein